MTFENIQQYTDFTGKVVIVTGGSKGIGEGCAKVFLSAGATVVICARGEKDGRATEAKFAAEFGADKILFLPCDVSKEPEVQFVIDETIRRFGRLDVLVNNAGYHPPYEVIDDTTNDTFCDLLQTNLVSIYNFCRLALPHLRKTKGNIVNMSSLVGSIGQKNACRYVSTKGGISGLTRALAVDEAKYGVRVNSIAPGCILTPLGEEFRAKSADPEREAKLSDSCSVMNKTGDIYEVGTVAYFLASDMAAFITGAEIPVSGGAELAYGNKCE